MTFYPMGRDRDQPGLVRKAMAFYRSNRIVVRLFYWWISAILYGSMAVAYLAATAQ